MRVTITGASGLIGTQLVERLRARGDDVTTLSRNPSSPGAVAWQPEDEPAPAEALAGRDAVVHLAGENVAQRWSDDAKRRIRSLARARHAQPRGRDRGGRPAPARAGLLLRRRLLRPARRRARSTSRPRPAATSSPSVCVVWEREARRAAEPRPARRHRPHRRRARPGRRRAGEDAAVLQALRRRPGRRRRPVPVVDPRRRRGRALPRGARRRGLGGSGQRQRPRAGHQQGVLEGARARAAPPRLRPGARPRRARRSTARWPRSSPRASASSRAARRSSGTRSRTRTSTRPCAARWSKRYLLMAVRVPPVSAASPVISASRGFWRRCHGLRSFHSAVASLGGIASQISGAEDGEDEARAEARPSRRSPSSATARLAHDRAEQPDVTEVERLGADGGEDRGHVPR